MLMQIACGCCTDPIPGTCARPLYGGTPLNSNSEVSGYTRDWSSYFGSSAYVTVNAYKTQITTADYLGFSGGTYKYEMKTRPFRWLAGGGTDDNNYVSDMCISKNCENRFAGPPSNCHLGSVSSSGLTYTAPCLAAYGVSGVTIAIEHARVVVDGVDASGIFAESGNSTNRYVPFTSKKLMTNKDIYLECWFKVNASFATIVTTARDAMFVTDISYPTNAAFTDAVGKMSFTGGDAKAKIKANKTIRLSFDKGGPGGVSTLDLEPQAGWSFSDTAGVITMVHTSTTDAIDFYFNREVPYIDVKIAAATYSGMITKCVYCPRGTEYEALYKYRATGLYESVYTMPQRGSWIPSTTQDFHIEGRRLASWDVRDYGVFKPEPYLDSIGSTDAMYTAFPRVVSVQLV